MKKNKDAILISFFILGMLLVLSEITGNWISSIW